MPQVELQGDQSLQFDRTLQGCLTQGSIWILPFTFILDFVPFLKLQSPSSQDVQGPQ